MASDFIDNSELFLSEIKRKKTLALLMIGEAGEGFAKLNVPVKTGNLRGSISHEEGEDYVDIGSIVNYATFVELGTSKMKAQPFLKPAVLENKDVYRDILETVLKG